MGQRLDEIWTPSVAGEISRMSRKEGSGGRECGQLETHIGYRKLLWLEILCLC